LIWAIGLFAHSIDGLSLTPAMKIIKEFFCTLSALSILLSCSRAHSQKITVSENKICPFLPSAQSAFNKFAELSETKHYMIQVGLGTEQFQKLSIKTKLLSTSKEGLVSAEKVVGSEKQKFFDFIPIFYQDAKNIVENQLIPLECLTLNSNHQLVLRKGSLEQQFRGAVVVHSNARFELLHRKPYSELGATELTALESEDINIFDWVKYQSAIGKIELVGDSSILDWNLENHSTLFQLVSVSENSEVKISVLTKDAGTQHFRHFNILIDSAARKLITSELNGNRVPDSNTPAKREVIGVYENILKRSAGLKNFSGVGNCEEIEINSPNGSIPKHILHLFKAKDNGLPGVDASLGIFQTDKGRSNVKGHFLNLMVSRTISLAVNWSGRLVFRPTALAENRLSRFIKVQNKSAWFRESGLPLFPNDEATVKALESNDIDFLEYLASYFIADSAESTSAFETLSKRQLKVDSTILASSQLLGENGNKDRICILVFYKDLASEEEACHSIKVDSDAWRKIVVDIEARLSQTVHESTSTGTSESSSSSTSSSSSSSTSSTTSELHSGSSQSKPRRKKKSRPDVIDLTEPGDSAATSGPKSKSKKSKESSNRPIKVYKNKLEWNEAIKSSTTGFGRYQEAVVSSLDEGCPISKFYLIKAIENGISGVDACLGAINAYGLPIVRQGHFTPFKVDYDSVFNGNKESVFLKDIKYSLAVNSAGRLVLRPLDVAEESLSRYIYRKRKSSLLSFRSFCVFPSDSSMRVNLESKDIDFIELLASIMYQSTASLKDQMDLDLLGLERLSVDNTSLHILGIRGEARASIFIYSKSMISGQDICYTISVGSQEWEKILAFVQARSQQTATNTTTCSNGNNPSSTASIFNLVDSVIEPATRKRKREEGEAPAQNKRPKSSSGSSAGKTTNRELINFYKGDSEFECQSQNPLKPIYTGSLECHFASNNQPASVELIFENGEVAGKINYDNRTKKVCSFRLRRSNSSEYSGFVSNGFRTLLDNLTIQVNEKGRLVFAKRVGRENKYADFLKELESWHKSDRSLGQMKENAVFKELNRVKFDKKLITAAILKCQDSRELSLVFFSLGETGLVCYELSMSCEAWFSHIKATSAKLSKI
jgi:hypothetical protein